MSADAAEAALHRLGTLWRRERETARARVAEERDRISLGERVRRGIALRSLSLEEATAAPGDRLSLSLRLPQGADTQLSSGTPVVLRGGDVELRGVVGRKDAELIRVLIAGELPEELEDDAITLERDAPEVTFDRGDRAIAAWCQQPPARAGRVLGLTAAIDVEPMKVVSLFDDHLEAQQFEAVRLALGSSDISLIHGPPGTGKTRTLVEIIRQLVARGERVLVTAASNTAVDNLAERLVASGVAAVRLGHPARVASSVQEHTLDAHVDASGAAKRVREWQREAMAIRRRNETRAARGTGDRGARREAFREARRLLKDARRHLRGAKDAVLSRAPVILSTAAGAETSLLDGQAFDVVVLDEATQCPDPIALVALLQAPRAILAGDPCQLPPTVLDRIAAQEGLSSTIFERVAAAAPASVRLLDVQHRMSEELMVFPSESMYGGALKAAPAVRALRLAELGVERPPWTFLDAAGRGWDEEHPAEDDPSLQNPGFAERIEAEARSLLADGVDAHQMAIIAAYDAQAQLLRSRFLDVPGLEVGTVDGFQGREKDVVLVDTVRSNGAGVVGFLAETRRMNVALTRARRHLFVLGDSGTLGSHPFYASLLEAAETSGAWRSAWE